MTTPSSTRSPGRQLSLGLSWLELTDDGAQVPGGPVASWRDFLERAEPLRRPPRLRWARLWPLLGAINGVAALSGLLLWPHGSGVHLLLFLLTFWAVPLLLMLWTAIASLGLGRAPWWRPLITAHEDRVIALWFGRQAIRAQLLFAAAGVGWLWLMLVTREVIFYWSTSIPVVSSWAPALFRGLGLGLLEAPGSAQVAAAEAGAITGWEGALLVDSAAWAGWLTGVVVLWVVLPAALLLLVYRWRLRQGVAQWPRYNRQLRLRFERSQEPALSYRALQPEDSLAQPPARDFPELSRLPAEPGFLWQLAARAMPEGCVALGQAAFEVDRQSVQANAHRIGNWYIGQAAVPTGDLADLVRAHQEAGGEPRLYIMAEVQDSARIVALKHSWSAFLDHNGLAAPVHLVTGDSR